MQTNRVDGWAALGDPTRKAIFELLVERPRAVVDLAGALPVSRPAVSQHLRVLRQAGLVADRRVGTRRVYHVEPDGLAALRADLDRFWCSVLAGYELAVEEATRVGEKEAGAAAHEAGAARRTDEQPGEPMSSQENR